MSACPECDAPTKGTFCPACGWDADLAEAAARDEDLDLPSGYGDDDDYDYDEFLRDEGLDGSGRGPGRRHGPTLVALALGIALVVYALVWRLG